MEISGYALLTLVKAARMSLKLAEDMRALMEDSHQRSTADEIAGLLTDALYDLSGEQQGVGDAFDESETMRLLTGCFCDAEVARRLEKMAKDAGVQDEEERPVCYEKRNPPETVNGGYQWKGEVGETAVKKHRKKHDRRKEREGRVMRFVFLIPHSPEEEEENDG